MGVEGHPLHGVIRHLADPLLNDRPRKGACRWGPFDPQFPQGRFEGPNEQQELLSIRHRVYVRNFHSWVFNVVGSGFCLPWGQGRMWSEGRM